MLSALLVTFREGLEAFLIVGVIVAYLRKTGREALVRGVMGGLVLSAILSALGGWLWWRALDRGDDFNQSLYEGIAALVAAALVGVLLWQVQRVGRHLKGDIERRIEAAASRGAGESSVLALLAVGGVTTLFVTREMAEALMVIGARAMGGGGLSLLVGSGVGLLAAAGYAVLWSKHGHKLRLHVILRATAIFLALFLVQLVLWGVHELSESGVIGGSQAFHDATERLGPDGDIGQIFAFVVAGVPLAIAAWSALQMLFGRDKRPASASTPA